MTYPNKAKPFKLNTLATQQRRIIKVNALVFIITTISLLLACYLTDKGFKKCLADGKFTAIECEKKHLG